MDFDYNVYVSGAVDYLILLIPGLIAAGVALAGGFWLANKADDVVERALSRSSLGPEISSFLASMTGIIVKFAAVLIAAGFVGFETASLVGILAAGAFAIGFALQGSLSNFAAGILILLVKPFRVDDWIGIGDEAFGRVEKIQILNTVIVSPGRKTLIVPNADIIATTVTNYSAKGVLRLELRVPIPYSVSYPEVEGVLRGVLAKAPYVMQDEPQRVGIESYDSHSITVGVRPYVRPDDFWAATFELNARIKAALHEAGIPVAYSEGVELGEIGR